MSIFIFIFLCFVPLLVCCILFCLFVPNFKTRYGLWASFVGLVSLIPIVFIQFFILNLPIFDKNNILSVLITAIIFNGLVEESVKMICLLLLPSKKTTFSVFFSMTLLSGLALGCFETLIYLFTGLETIWQRLFTAVLIHTFCAGLSGIYVWTFKHKNSAVTPFIFSAVLHGLYNFFAGFSGAYKWFSILAIGMAILECRIWYTKIKNPNL